MRLDKKTGDIVVVDGERLVKPINAEDEAKVNVGLGQKKDWGSVDIPQLKGIKINLSTTWIDGKLHYQIEASPGKAVESARSATLTNKFSILLYDAGGFKLVEISAPLFSMSRSVDEKGEALSFDMNDSVDCPVDTYKKIQSWNVLWNFRL